MSLVISSALICAIEFRSSIADKFCGPRLRGAEILLHLLQLTTYRAVVNRAAHAYHNSTQKLGVRGVGRANFLAGQALQLRFQLALPVRGKRARAGDFRLRQSQLSLKLAVKQI